MRTAAWVFVAYLGTQIVLQPAIWMMDGDRDDFLLHAAVYAAIAPIILAAGVGLAVFSIFKASDL